MYCDSRVVAPRSHCTRFSIIQLLYLQAALILRVTSPNKATDKERFELSEENCKIKKSRCHIAFFSQISQGSPPDSKRIMCWPLVMAPFKMDKVQPPGESLVSVWDSATTAPEGLTLVHSFLTW